MVTRRKIQVQEIEVNERGKFKTLSFSFPPSAKKIIGFVAIPVMSFDDIRNPSHYYAVAPTSTGFGSLPVTQVFLESKVITFSVAPSPTEKIYYARPRSLGKNISFLIDGELAAFSTVTIEGLNDLITNYFEDYYLFESDDYGDGSTKTITVI